MIFSEDRLNMTAQDIVDTFVSTGETLTTLVKTKVASMGWNNTQAARLIEKVNGEAFLKLFPEKTSFAVAEPEAVTGVKVAHVVEDKTSQNPAGYAKSLERDPHELFGVEHVKFASSAEVTPNYSKLAFLDSVYAEKIGDSVRIKLASDAIDLNEKINTAYYVVKEAVLLGRGFDGIETEVHERFPESTMKVAGLVQHIHDRLAADTSIDIRLLKRASVEDLNLKRIHTDNEIAEVFRNAIS